MSRKFNLESNGIVEINTDIKFVPISKGGENHYYFVVSEEQEANLVSLTAVSSISA